MRFTTGSIYMEYTEEKLPSQLYLTLQLNRLLGKTQGYANLQKKKICWNSVVK